MLRTALSTTKNTREVLGGSSSSRPVVIASTLICLGYIAARVWSFAHVFGRKPPLQPDSIDYLRAASLSLTDQRFWTYWKPWGLPLFYKLLPGSNAVACIVQFSIATLAWIVLGLTVARFLRHPMLKADTVQAEMRENAWSAAG